MKYQDIFKSVVLLGLLVTPCVAFLADTTLHSMLTLTSRWLPTSYPERQILEEFKSQFETGDAVLVTWDGCDQSSPQIDETRIRLVQLRNNVNDSYYDTILTSRDVTHALNQLPYTLARETIEERQRGLLLGISDESQALIVGLTENGIQHRNEAIKQIVSLTSDAAGIPEEDILMAGPPVDGWYVDSEAESDLDYLTPPSMIVSAVLCLWCLRSVPHSTGVLTAALLTQGIVLATMYLLGLQMSALYIVLPPLVFTLTVSSGIHLANYFQDELRIAEPTEAVTNALKHGAGPCLLATGTTSIGLLSLLASDIIPVARFGVLAAFGVMTGLMLVFLLLPGIQERWPGHSRQDENVSGFSLNLSRKSCLIIVLISLGIMIVCGFGVSKLETSVKLESLFNRDSEIIKDYQTLESRFGPLVPAEILITFENSQSEGTTHFWERMNLVKSISRDIRASGSKGGVLSAALFAPETPEPQVMNEPGAADEQIILSSDLPAVEAIGELTPHSVLRQEQFLQNELVEKLRDKLRSMRLLYVGETGEIWRVSTRVPALGKEDYATALNNLEQIVQANIDRMAMDLTQVNLEFTGIMPMVSRVQQVLLHDLFVSFISAFGLVALVVIVVLRSFWGGIVAMLPNVFPALVIFGVMGWLSIPVDIGAMMTASVALGIAVDDTFHFLIWYRRGLSEGLDSSAAVTFAYRRCAKAMMQTTLICGLGMAVFGLSGFLPTQRFAALIATMLMTALIGDLIFLPALLTICNRTLFMAKSENNSKIG